MRLFEWILHKALTYPYGDLRQPFKKCLTGKARHISRRTTKQKATREMNPQTDDQPNAVVVACLRHSWISLHSRQLMVRTKSATWRPLECAFVLFLMTEEVSVIGEKAIHEGAILGHAACRLASRLYWVHQQSPQPKCQPKCGIVLHSSLESQNQTSIWHTQHPSGRSHLFFVPPGCFRQPAPARFGLPPRIWFASDGVWDEEKTPSFGTDLIPKGRLAWTSGWRPHGEPAIRGAPEVWEKASDCTPDSRHLDFFYSYFFLSPPPFVS